MEFFIIYLFVSIEKIANLLYKLGTWSFIGLALFLIVAFLVSFTVIDNGESGSEQFNKSVGKHKKLLKFAFFFGVISMSISAIMPSREETAMIIGGGVTYNILTSAQAKEVGGKSLELLNLKLQEMIDNTTPKKEIVTDITVTEE